MRIDKDSENEDTAASNLSGTLSVRNSHWISLAFFKFTYTGFKNNIYL